MRSLTYSSACAFELPLDCPLAQIPPLSWLIFLLTSLIPWTARSWWLPKILHQQYPLPVRTPFSQSMTIPSFFQSRREATSLRPFRVAGQALWWSAILVQLTNSFGSATLNTSWNTYIFPLMNSNFVHSLPLALESMQEQLPTTVSQRSRHGILPITWSGKAVPASGMSLTVFTTVHLGGQGARPILVLTQGCSSNSSKVSISIYPWMLQLQLVQ